MTGLPNVRQAGEQRHQLAYLACLAIFAPLAVLGCQGERARDTIIDSAEPAATPHVRATTERSAPPSPSTEASLDDARMAVVALGDSLTAGYGMRADEAYPAFLQQKIDAKGLPFKVVNAGVSGDTTAGGRRRLGWAIDGQDVSVLIVALGGNDGLRGLPVKEMRDNLAAILDEAHTRGVRVLLTGMEAPPNNGPRYTDAFRDVFSELAGEHNVVFFPFLLKDVAGSAELNQRDGIHPNSDGAQILADNLWQYLEPMLAESLSTEP